MWSAMWSAIKPWFQGREFHSWTVLSVRVLYVLVISVFYQSKSYSQVSPVSPLASAPTSQPVSPLASRPPLPPLPLPSPTTTPSLGDFFDEPIEGIPSSERPKDPILSLPETMSLVPLPATADERAELASWARWLVLKNLPPSFEDNRKWNRQKEVFDGIHIHREGWNLETKRKKKLAKHGTWSRYYIEFLDPEKDLGIEITKLEFPKSGSIHIETKVLVPLKLFGRVSQWSRDVQLFSISANAHSKVELNVVCDIEVYLNPLKMPPDVEFRPLVRDASVALREFEVERISQIHGPVAELLGKGIREILDDRLDNYREKLVQKMNGEIAKQLGKLKLSIHDWLRTSVKKKVE